METLGKSGLKNYTKIVGVYGKGTTSGTHMGDDIWPGRNNIIFVACEESKKENLIFSVRELRKTLGREGIKAFTFALEEVS